MPPFAPQGTTDNYLKKLILITSLGLIEAIKRGDIDYGEAEKILFSPATLAFVEHKKLGGTLKDIIHMGTELGDVATITPLALEEALSEMSAAITNELKESPPICAANQRWYHQISLTFD